jgi:predicted porin
VAFAALAAASAFAYAESNVTLYGIIETGVVAQKEKDVSAKVHMGSAFDLGSRWGIKGQEDLGNGTKVGFILENGFNPTSGATAVGGTGAMFGRESVIYLQNDRFGRFGAGKAGTLYSGLGSWDMQTGYVFKGGYGLIGWPIGQNFAGNFNRVSNALIYQSPFIGGFRLGLMYSNGTSDDSAKWSKNTHYFGSALQYKKGAINSSLAFEAQNHQTSTVDEKTVNVKPKYIINYGLEYNAGSITPMFAYRYITQDGGYKMHTFGLSALIPAATGRFKAAVRYSFGKSDNAALVAKSFGGDDKVRNLAAGVAYEYPLSKRTAIKPFVGYSYSGKGWSHYQPAAADVNAVYNGWQAYVGIHHFF